MRLDVRFVGCVGIVIVGERGCMMARYDDVICSLESDGFSNVVKVQVKRLGADEAFCSLCKRKLFKGQKVLSVETASDLFVLCLDRPSCRKSANEDKDNLVEKVIV